MASGTGGRTRSSTTTAGNAQRSGASEARAARGGKMDSRQFFGDSVVGTLIRLVLLSIVVGIIFSALGITPFNLIDRLNHLIRNLMELSADTLRWALGYFLLGAVIVFPIWFVLRLFGRRRDR
jgi:hypothetical protein